MSQSKVKNESGTKVTWKPPHPAEHGHSMLRKSIIYRKPPSRSRVCAKSR